jgi:hypothetical protein
MTTPSAEDAILGFWRAVGRGIASTARWLASHEPVRFGAVVQVCVLGLTGWLMALADRVGLPNNIAEVIVGLAGAAVYGRIEEWKRKTVTSPATVEKVVERVAEVAAVTGSAEAGKATVPK